MPSKQKEAPIFKNNGLTIGTQSTLTTIIIILVIYKTHGVTTIFFSNRFGVGGIRCPKNSILLHESLIKE